MAIVNTVPIFQMLNDINKPRIGGIFLPHIQRNFVWDDDKIYRLMDSLMRGYPVGSILTWETSAPISYRPFVQDYVSTLDFDDFVDTYDGADSSRKYVLDGQQRLQSLYLALYGTYEGKELYFNLKSDPSGDEGYEFCFLDKPKAFWIRIKDFVVGIPDAAEIPAMLRKRKIVTNDHTDTEVDRLERNAMRLHHIFHVYTPIPHLTLGYADNIGIGEIAEVFVRINNEGAILEKADLLMAIVKNSWAEAGREFARISSELQELGFKKTRDFVLRTFLAMLGKGTNLNLNIFAQPDVQEALKNQKNFSCMETALRETLDFVSKYKFIGGAKNIPSWDPLLLLACHRYYHPMEWDDNRARNFLLISFLSKAFGRSSPKFLDAMVKGICEKSGFSGLKKIAEDHNRSLEPDKNDILEKINYKDQNKVRLVLHLICQSKKGFPKNDDILHVDHVFPIQLCKSKKIRADRYHQLANLTLMTPAENLNKKDTKPDVWFGGRQDDYLDRHLLPKGQSSLLKIDNFEEFITVRKAIIDLELDRIINNLRL